MPSMIGHALAGATTVWTADALDRQPSSPRLLLTCAVLAAIPDIDLLLSDTHRGATHSVTAVAMVLIIAAAVTGRVTRWRTSLLCAAAYATHLLLDWLAADYYPPQGLQILWPFSRSYFISGWDLFLQTERRNFWTAASLHKNFLALVRELVVLGPIAGAAYLARSAARNENSVAASRRTSSSPW